jgi:uncharacterized protein VirK/YbjX
MSADIKSSDYFSFNKLVKASSEVYPKNNVRSLANRMFFFAKSIKNKTCILSFYNNINRLGYSHILQHKPVVLGNIAWPYIHKDWDADRRFASITKHYALLKNLPSFLDVSNGEPKIIVNLGAYSENTSIILDKPSWFVREGEIVLNIFLDDLRVMSLAFCLGQDNNETILYVGGIQGIHNGIASDKSLKTIKQLTKNFHGLRPRSFVITILKMIALKIGATKILAIDQTHRHHWHPYFKSSAKSLSLTNYDEIWKEHEGIACKDGFYLLKPSKAHKDLREIESKKRSQYRKRYEMLDDVAHKISQLN